MKLNEEGVDWAGEDLSYLEPNVWSSEWEEAVAGATVVASLEEFAEKKCSGGSSKEESVKFLYGDLNTYPNVAHRFGYIDDAKAGVPRTAFKGTVTFPHKGCTKYAVPGSN